MLSRINRKYCKERIISDLLQEQYLMQIFVVVANTQVRNLRTEVEKGFI